MKGFPTLPIAVALICLAAPAAAQSGEDIAKAYVQAITGGSKSKAAGGIDFAALGCEPATVFDEGRCQKIVKDGKDGKTFLMESLTEANVANLLPADDMKRVFGNGDASFAPTRMMFFNLSTNGNGLFPGRDGKGKAKAILQAYLEQLGSQGMYGYFGWPFDATRGEEARMTAAGVSIRFNGVPSSKEREKMAATGYFWALQVGMTEMAYPADFVPPAGENVDMKKCKNTTTSWGHVGFQLHKDGLQRINWGGGGNGSGRDDYGCGGSDLTPTPFDVGVWYEYRVERGDRLGPKLWLWVGEVYNEKTGARIYQKAIYGGEYLSGAPMSWIETFNRACADPKVSTEWKAPWIGTIEADHQLKKFRIGNVGFGLPNDACWRSRENVVSTCTAEWRQEVGAVWNKAPDGSPAPPDPAQESDLRSPADITRIEESYCGRAPDETEIEIASAYVNAISGGAQRSVPGVVDYEKLGCDANTVRDPKKCQAAVFNKQNGQTVLMNAITSAKSADWAASNIKRLIPEDAMRRITTDPRFKQAKELFLELSAPGNDSFPWLSKPGMAKDVLRQYMSSVH